MYGYLVRTSFFEGVEEILGLRKVVSEFEWMNVRDHRFSNFPSQAEEAATQRECFCFAASRLAVGVIVFVPKIMGKLLDI